MAENPSRYPLIFDSTRKLRVALVVKRSAFRLYLDEKNDSRLKKLAENNDPLVVRLRASHEEHEATVAEVKRVLSHLNADSVAMTAGARFDSENFDLVVTVGGDGTLLGASHNVKSIPILGVNSAPLHSVGFFCGAKPGEVEGALERILGGTMESVTLSRMKVSVNSRVVAARVLNDALFCHASPAATTRYSIRFRDVEEDQKSSGFWIGPAAGSTAAQRSAGGQVLPLTSTALQLVVREPYTPQGKDYLLQKIIVEEGEVVSVRSKMHDARLFFDGPANHADVAFGDVIEFERAPEPLLVFGSFPQDRSQSK